MLNILLSEENYKNYFQKYLKENQNISMFLHVFICREGKAGRKRGRKTSM